jgi:hypothetical protein
LNNTYYAYGDNNVMFDGGDLYLYNGDNIYRISNILTNSILAAPTVSASSATSVATTTATLNGSIDNIGSSTPTVEGFEYGLDTAYGLATSTAGAFGTGAFSATLSGLVCGTTYHYHAYATNSGGSGTSGDISFTTSACSTTIPAVSSSVATLIASSTVTLNGSIDIDGTASSTVRGFNYGITSGYGSSTSTTGTYGVGTFIANLTGLSCGTVYHFNAFATDPSGTGSSEDGTFVTGDCPPVVHNVYAPANPQVTAVTSTSISLSWDTGVADLGLAGYNLYRNGSFLSSFNSLTQSFTDTGLSSSTPYSYFVTTIDNESNESTDSSTVSTTTLAVDNGPTLPIVATSLPMLITTSSATLNGSITFGGNASSTVEGFNYGTSQSYGQTASASGTFGTGSFNQSITGLSCGTTYHYQSFASNSAGTQTSGDETFATAACPLIGGGGGGASFSSGGGAASLSILASLLAPGAATTAYLNLPRFPLPYRSLFRLPSLPRHLRPVRQGMRWRSFRHFLTLMASS